MERVFNTAKVFASRMDADERTMAAATLVQRLAAKNDELADHALDTGSLAARLAQSMGLSYDDVVETSLIGTLHEVGAIVVPAAVLDGLEFAAPSEVLRVQRAERRAAVALVRSVPAIADLADAVGSLFDDVVPTLTARIVVVADQYDYLVRDFEICPGISGHEALAVLKRHAGVRYDRHVVAALGAMLRLVHLRELMEELGAACCRA